MRFFFLFRTLCLSLGLEAGTARPHLVHHARKVEAHLLARHEAAQEKGQHRGQLVVQWVQRDGVDAPSGEGLRRAAANLERVHVLPQQGLNVYSILQQRTLILTEASLAELVTRITRPIKR